MWNIDGDDPARAIGWLMGEVIQSRNEIRSVPFDHDVAAEPQNFADQLVILVSVRDDNGVNPLVDALHDEPEVEDALQCPSPVVPQRGLAVNDPRRFREKLGRNGRGEYHVFMEVLQNGLDVVGIPCF